MLKNCINLPDYTVIFWQFFFLRARKENNSLLGECEEPQYSMSLIHTGVVLRFFVVIFVLFWCYFGVIFGTEREIVSFFRSPISDGAKRKVDCFLQKEFCDQKRWEGIASNSADLPVIMAVRGEGLFHYDPRPRKAYNMVAFMKALAGIEENAEGDNDNGGTEVFISSI